MSISQILQTGVVVALCVTGLADSAYCSVLANVEPGGWEETEPGGGKWDDQNVNNPGPFPNIVAALMEEGLPTTGLAKVLKIDAPLTAGSGFGADFTMTGQGGTSGTWSINQDDLLLTGGKILAYFSLKAAKSWNLWEITADTDLNALTYTNAWDTNASGGGLLTPNGKNFARLSHIIFWAIDAPPPPPPSSAPVPEPVSLWVWSVLSLAGLCLLWRGRTH